MLKLNRHTKSSRRTALLLMVLLILFAGSILALTRHKYSPVIPSTNPLSESQKTGSDGTSGSSQSQQSQSSNNTAPNTAQSGPAPLAPFGNFVSNHHPGGNSPTSEASTCNTSAGATCYIQFTKGSVVKKLDSQTTDARGGAIWYWDIKNAGLTQGSWSITAVATLNGQTKTTVDAQPLVVQ